MRYTVVNRLIIMESIIIKLFETHPLPIMDTHPFAEISYPPSLHT